MQYQIFRVNMPDPRAPGGGSSGGPSSGPEMVGGHFHVVTKQGHKTDNELAKLAGPGVIIAGLESQRQFSHAEIQAMAQKYRQEWNHKHLVTDLIPDYSTKAPFQD